MKDYRYTLHFEALGAPILPFAAHDLDGETRAQQKVRLESETRFWGIEANPNVTPGARAQIGGVSIEARTYFPLSPRQWETLFYIWRVNHGGEVAVTRGLSPMGGPLWETEHRFDPAPRNPMAFLVWLEWLEENPARREHFERWRAHFAPVLEAGRRFDELHDTRLSPDPAPEDFEARERELGAAFGALTHRFPSPLFQELFDDTFEAGAI